MKVVFIADLQNSSSSGFQRKWALEQCGVEVVVINKNAYQPSLGRLSGVIAKLVRNPQLIRDTVRLEHDILTISVKERPDIVWIEWAKEIRPKVLEQLKKLTPRPYLISFQDDNPWGNRHGDKWMWRNYFKLVPHFDLHLVKRESDILNLQKLGAKWCRLWEHGVYRPIFFPLKEITEKVYPVSFIGTCMDMRASFIGYLLEQNLPVHIFGTHWRQRSNLPARFPLNFHEQVLGDQYAMVIRQSQICVGFVSHSNQDEWTMRTYEVPGCAGLLLAERTPKHKELFIEGKEAVFFSDSQECNKQIVDLLTAPQRCMKIGSAAYEKCLTNNWTIEGRMLLLLKELN